MAARWFDHQDHELRLRTTPCMAHIPEGDGFCHHQAVEVVGGEWDCPAGHRWYGHGEALRSTPWAPSPRALPSESVYRPVRRRGLVGAFLALLRWRG